MKNLTIVSKLRMVAVLTPAILLMVAATLGVALHIFGGMPRMIYQNQYSAARAANGMENALYQMDWGRSQLDSSQIVVDQQRRFIDWIETARTHIDGPKAADKISRVADTARPLFEAMRSAQPGDETIESRLRELEGLVADLIAIDEAAMLTLGERAESQARTMIAITIVGAVMMPWICFVAITRMTGRLEAELKQIRRQVDKVGERAPGDEVRALDVAASRLGFPKPNPMLEE